MKKLLLALMFPLCAVFAADNSMVPQFKDYPADDFYGQKATIVFDEETYNFRTRFKRLAKQPLNFAGHFAITFIGCGTGCSMGLGYDAKTGKTFFLPSLTDCRVNGGYHSPERYFRKESRLIVLAGNYNESTCLTRYYLAEDNDLVLLKEVPFTPTPE